MTEDCQVEMCVCSQRKKPRGLTRDFLRCLCVCVSDYARIIKDLFNRTDKADEGTLAECFVALSYLRGDVFPLIQYFIGDEFMSGGIAGALMRENVIASKLIKAYIRT